MHKITTAGIKFRILNKMKKQNKIPHPRKRQNRYHTLKRGEIDM